MVLVLHTCQCQDRGRDDCVLSVRSGPARGDHRALRSFLVFGKTLEVLGADASSVAELKAEGLCASHFSPSKKTPGPTLSLV